MISIEVHEVGIEDEAPLIMVGFSESADDTGRDFFFQCDLRSNDYLENSNWPRGDSYCVVDENARTSYGGVRELVFRGNVVRIVFDDSTVDALKLEDSVFELVIDAELPDMAQVKAELMRVLTCGRPEFRPTVLEIS